MEDFLRSLLSLSIGGSLITLLLLLLRGGIRGRLPKSFYYYAWLLVLLRMILPIPGQMHLELPKPAQPVAEFTETAQFETPLSLPAQAQEVPEAMAVSETGRKPTGRIPQYIPPAETAPDIPQAPRLNMALCLTVLWAAGFLFTLGRDLAGYFRFRHAIRKTLIHPQPSDLAIYCQLAGPRRPRLCRSAAVDTPMLMGILHPTLLLPDRRYSPEILECVFRHELIHYARRDILYKWFAVPVLAVHWFNPLTIFIRRDIDRCCELSCDERILKEMDHDQRKSYGETLLVLAARSAPARTALSTSFATEKKNLKERLVHIMNFSPKSKWAILAAAVLLIAVAVCAVIFGPQAEPAQLEAAETTAATVETTEPQEVPATEAAETQVTTAPGEATAVVVKTVDEFLDAIGSNTEITLEPGVYDLTKAKGYGGANVSDSYHWQEEFDGFALSIDNVQNLTIIGADKEVCEIVTTPRYAAVLGFENCENIKISNITSGHTEGPGSCVGAVIRTISCANMNVDNCILYGCGTYGLESYLSNGINIVNSDIKECSLGAVSLMECKNIQIRASRIFDCAGYDLFGFGQSRNCAVIDCEITKCSSNTMMQTISCKDIYFVSNKVSDCEFGLGVFDYSGAAPTVDSSSFQRVGNSRMAAAIPDGSSSGENGRIDGKVQSLDGGELTGDQLRAMSYKDTDFTMPIYEIPVPVVADYEADAPEGTTVVEASTVDEFLAAIAPNTTVVLSAGNYDLSTASDYGTGWTDYYRWVEEHDGYELELMNLENFHIQGAGQGNTIFTAVPRYADVLVYQNCSNVSIAGITAGHTIEPGYCTGGVLNFYSCDNVTIDSSGLYGCGIYGIIANACWDFTVTNTEIYDCSYGAVWLEGCENFVFDGCNIHDCPLPYFGSLGSCKNITIDGKTTY